MKSPWIQAALVAVVSSLVTLAAVEFLRDAPAPLAALATERVQTEPAEPPGEEEARLLPPTTSTAPTATEELATGPSPLEVRLAELERRLEALELESSNRAPILPPDEQLPPRDELRELVIDWVDEEREARSMAAAAEGEAAKLKELEFGARHQALMLAQEHGLEKWQEEEFAKLFLEMAHRTREIEESIDITRDDPAEVEARWAEFDEWIDRRERELTMQLDPELYEKIYGDG